MQGEQQPPNGAHGSSAGLQSRAQGVGETVLQGRLMLLDLYPDIQMSVWASVFCFA